MSITLKYDSDPKTLRETLCVAQSLVASAVHISQREKRGHLIRIQQLIDECDKHRPLGPDGKHGNRHTGTCGCLDKD